MDIVFFIERQVKIITDPVFGKLSEAPSTNPSAKSTDGGKHFSHIRTTGSSFGITTFAVKRNNLSEAQDHQTDVKI